jgi:plastocyanin
MVRAYYRRRDRHYDAGARTTGEGEPMKKRLAVAMLVLSLAAAACSSDADKEEDEGTETGQKVDVTMQDSKFNPSTITIEKGQDLELINKDGFEHNFSITSANISVDIAAGEDQEPALGALTAGTYDFFCKYHSGMTGKLTVT